MAANSNIEWTDQTWNPVVGCSKVSPGCAHCYAETMAARLKAMALTDIAAGRDPGRKRYYIDAIDDKGRWSGRLITVPEALGDPRRWNKPRRVFVNSMSDLFHESVPFDFVDSVFDVMWSTPHHVYQILTKRPDRMVEYVRERAYRQSFGWTDKGREPMAPGYVAHYDDIVGRNQCGYVGDGDWECAHPESSGGEESCHCLECPIAYAVRDRESLVKIGVADSHKFDSEGYAEDSEWMEFHARPKHALPGNVWFGFSAENQNTFSSRMQMFRPMRWVSPYITLFCSMEPLLGPIVTTIKYWDENDKPTWNALSTHDFSDGGGQLHVPYLNWVIVGGESGHDSRPCRATWVRDIVRQCQDSRVSVFVKQLGGNAETGYGTHRKIDLKNKKGGDMSKWPEDLRVREFPTVNESAAT